MLVKVHSYYSTTFVPGQFTPEGWDFLQGFPTQGIQDSIIDSDNLEIVDMGAETFLDFTFSLSAETNINLNAFLDVVPFVMGITTETDVSLGQVFNSSLLVVGEVTPTDIQLSQVFISNTVNVAETKATDISLSQIFSSGSILLLAFEEVNDREAMNIVMPTNSIFEPIARNSQIKVVNDLSDLTSSVELKSKIDIGMEINSPTASKLDAEQSSPIS